MEVVPFSAQSSSVFWNFSKEELATQVHIPENSLQVVPGASWSQIAWFFGGPQDIPLSMNAKIGFEARRRKIKEKKTMLISLYIFISYYTIIDKFTLSR